MNPLCLVVSVTFVFALCAVVAAADAPTLHVFGDSLSDVGILKNITYGLFPPTPYWNGRFTSGPVWNEYVALLLGYGIDNRAVGAAHITDSRVKVLTFIPMDVPSTRDQIVAFQTDNPNFAQSAASTHDIAILGIGTNDIRFSLSEIASNKVDTGNFTESLSDTVIDRLQQLKEVGFKNIFLVNIPNLEHTPIVRLTNKQQVARDTVAAYNEKLAAKANTWAQSAGVEAFGIADLGTYADLSVKPSVASALGLLDTTTSCIGGNALNMIGGQNYIGALQKFIFNTMDFVFCGNSSTTYFFDPIHPNDRVHRLFGYYVHEVIAARLADSAYELTEDGLLALIQTHNLNTPAPRPAQV
ncbi:hypothetical protein GQ54DRAFT_299001 [Martensiomyces pterosporus]|nr:hypothetical protein GQ54DRAFT_299001 [Martensiomyces pterosporus]